MNSSLAAHLLQQSSAVGGWNESPSHHLCQGLDSRWIGKDTVWQPLAATWRFMLSGNGWSPVKSTEQRSSGEIHENQTGEGHLQ